MVERERGIAQEKFRSHNRIARKSFVLLVIYGFAVLFPLTFFPLGVLGRHASDFYNLCAIAQSASIFYGADYFNSTRSSYIWSLISFFVVTVIVGAIGFLFFTEDISFHDGSCFVHGGPTYLFFFLIHVEFLPVALIISTLWLAIRWIENTVQVTWFRKNHQKMLKV